MPIYHVETVLSVFSKDEDDAMDFVERFIQNAEDERLVDGDAFKAYLSDLD